ncbi:MAG: septation protein A [Patescibacteria group bacterium]
MKILFDFLPIIAFFIVFKWQGIYAATAVAIFLTAAIILLQVLRKQKVAPAMWISLIIIVLFGGATILLHNEWFIKWKPTILYWIFATILIIGELFFNKNLIKKLVDTNIDLPDPVWKNLIWTWSSFFVIVGFINITVAYTFSTETWVNFKLFGLLSLTLIFAVVQGFYISKFVNDK